MTRLIPRLAVGFFAAWLVLLSGVVYPQLAAHAEQHAHHSATTHANALCSWLCAAGQTAEGSAPPALAPVAGASPAIQREYSVFRLSSVSLADSRGPPFLVIPR
jgi:hypothetical protein